MSYKDKMFNSTPMRGLQLTRQESLNETSNDISRILSKPSSPSTSLHPTTDQSFATPHRTGSFPMRRYSLSEVGPVSPRYNQGAQKHNGSQSRNNSRYNLSKTTQLDISSPGFTGRLVRYNEEKEKLMPTHQPKYSGVGVFPIVHLFKKDLPPLKRKPTKVTVRIASPEMSKFNTPEHNRMLLESIVQTTPNRMASPRNSDVGTRSVLDALKEISRKRIHASEELDLNEDGKRIRLECLSGSENKKRTRDPDSPQPDDPVSPNNRLMKKVCSTMDELKASFSSSVIETSLEEPPKSMKRKLTAPEISPNPKEAKQKNLVDVETQTIVPEVISTATNSEPEVEIVVSTPEKPPLLPKKVSPPSVKVFDESPLEVMRKSRLSVLMGALSKDKANKTAAEQYEGQLKDIHETKRNTVEKDGDKSPEKPLISILAGPQKKSPFKKHVTFSIPESTVSSGSETNTSSAFIPAPNKTTPISFTKLNNTNNFSVTQTSTALVTPIVSSSVENSPKSKAEEANVTPAVGMLSAKAVEKAPITAVVSSPPSNQPSVAFTPPKSVTPPALNPQVSSPQFSFGGTNKAVSFSAAPVTPIANITLPKSLDVSSPPKKAGGFKFDLPKTITSTPKSPVSTFTFSASKTEAETNKSFAFGASTSTPNFMFTPPKPAASVSAATLETVKTMFGTPSSVTSTVSTTSVTSSSGLPATVASMANSTPSFNSTSAAAFVAPGVPITTSNLFNNNQSLTNPSSFGDSAPGSFTLPQSTTANSFGAKTPTAFSSVSTTSFGTAPTQAFTVPTTTASFPTPAFGTFPPSTTAAAPPAFGSTAAPPPFAAVTTTAPSAFGINATPSSFVAPAFGTVTSTPSFGASNVPPPAFGVTTQSSAPSAFGVTTQSSAPPAFGVVTTTTASSTSFTATTTAPPAFGTTPTGFGSTSSTSAFGSNPGFGVVTPNKTSLFTFGNNTPTTSTFGSSSNIFDSKQAFGSPTNTPNFGTTVTSASNFGTQSTPSYTGPTASSAFSVPSSFSFNSGTNNSTLNPTFGSTNTANVFGGSASTGFGAKPPAGFSTATPGSFGGTPAAGSGFGFGTVTTTANSATIPFGAGSSTFNSTNSTFGTATTSSAFGSTITTTPSFGVTATPSFGAAAAAAPAPSFGVTTAPSFGASTNTPSFGSNTTTNGFGSTSAFGSATANSSFGNQPPPPAFGSATAPAANFGSSFGSGFGSSTFGKTEGGGFGQTAANTFGGTTNNVSGTFTANPPPPTTTAQSGVFAFGSTNVNKPPGAVFSFGSSEPPKPSFNFTAGANSTFGPAANSTSFTGGAPPPAFGAVVPTPQFNAQPGTAGMFSIGSGSSTPNRARTQLKAKRRT